MAKFAFVGTISSFPWGGSEILWSQAAERLCDSGHHVFASVSAWPTPRPAVQRLRQVGIRVTERRRGGSTVPQRIFRKLARPLQTGGYSEIERWLASVQPDLVCVSAGGVISLEVLELVLATGIPVVTIAQAHSETNWPDDALAGRWRDAWNAAVRCFFVSYANLKLAECQIACPLPNAVVVANPVQVTRDEPPAWPARKSGANYQFANVARLHPPSKGQDILLQTLSLPKWRERPIQLNFYGAGPMEQTLHRYVEMLDLTSAVQFLGHVAVVRDIWRTNQLLLLPSRYEGLPLALVEAMLCGRPAVVTDVAGNKEVVTDGVTGFLASAPTVGCFDMALEAAWQRRDEWPAIGMRARRAALEYLPEDAAGEFAAQMIEIVRSASCHR